MSFEGYLKFATFFFETECSKNPKHAPVSLLKAKNVAYSGYSVTCYTYYERLRICYSFSKVSFFAPVIWNIKEFEFRHLEPGAKTMVVSTVPKWLLGFFLRKRGPHGVTVPPT